VSPAPTLTLVIDRVPITITYRYATDTWTVHHDDPDVRDAYETMFRDATDGAWSLLNRYAPHPQLDRIEELAKTWNIRVHGIAELRSWIASKPLLVERLY
jgi:hypothetical protein